MSKSGQQKVYHLGTGLYSFKLVLLLTEAKLSRLSFSGLELIIDIFDISKLNPYKVHQHTLEHNLLQAGESYDYGQGDVNEVYFVLDDGLKESINKATKDYADHIGDLVISYARDYEVTRKVIGFLF